MSGSVDSFAERIRSIDWDADAWRTRSRVALMREYLRRSAMWAQELDADEWPFFDVAALAAPGVRADQGLVDSVAGDPNVFENGPLVRDTCLWALHMEAAKNSGTALPDLPDMFEPLILMYERGGGFSLSSTGTIDVDGVGIPRQIMPRHLEDEQKAPMGWEELDSLDS